MPASNGTKTGKAKLDAVTALLDKLQLDLDKHTLTPHQRVATLEELKIYGRNEDDSDPIYTKEGIETLARHAFNAGPDASSREAMRCLANALLLKEPTRQMLVDLSVTPRAAEMLKSGNTDDEFLLSRILFLITYGTNADFEKLIDENRLADAINQCVIRHSKRYSHHGGHSLSKPISMDDMALTESCKLIFNILHFYPDLSEHFSKSIPPLIKILHKIKITEPPLQQPVPAVINALINLDLNDTKNSGFGYSALFPKVEAKANAEHIINILDAAIAYYAIEELDQLASPVITLIRKMYKIAPDQVKKFMEWLLLPTDSERNKPLGKSDTLSSRLLQLSTSALTPTLRTSISAMMFELSGEDSTKFVRNVGYGFAAGFLMNQGIPVPQDAMEAFSSEDGKGEGEVEINPITGQRKDMEPEDTGPPMTQDEKEREAERLFVLFERLKRTGVVEVKNPVEQAMQEGRFEELPDDSSE